MMWMVRGENWMWHIRTFSCGEIVSLCGHKGNFTGTSQLNLSAENVCEKCVAKIVVDKLKGEKNES